MTVDEICSLYGADEIPDDAPPINRVRVAWQYEGESDYFNDCTYSDLHEAVKGILHLIFPTIDFSHGITVIPNKSPDDTRPTYFEFVNGHDKVGIL